jgi:DNA modification methylase
MTDLQLLKGDCLDLMPWLVSDESVDALVCDPPAGIGFMGKEWDHHKGGRREWIEWMTEIMRECLRVMKPGAHGLVWALPRTSHWTATALEDAGFEVRDVVTHLFGSGFPKSLDVSKAIDKAAGAERELVGYGKLNPRDKKSYEPKASNDIFDRNKGMRKLAITAPSTDAAKQWQGWGTSLKPAVERWLLVRKPLTTVPLDGILRETSLLFEDLICRFAPAKFAQKILASNPKDLGDLKLGFAQWIADVSHTLLSQKESELMDMFRSQAEAKTFSNIVLSWNAFLDALCDMENKSIIKIETELTTDLKTLSFLISQITQENTTQDVTTDYGIHLSAINAAPVLSAIEMLTLNLSKYFAQETASIVAAQFHDQAQKLLKTERVIKGAGWSEDIILIRKPISEKTVAANVLKWGCGALNIDASRIDGKPRTTHANGNFQSKTDETGKIFDGYGLGVKLSEPQGRFPANLVFSHTPYCTDDQCDIECAVKELDAQSAHLHGAGHARTAQRKCAAKGMFRLPGDGNRFGDSGGASRFFYCAKISKAERNAGLDDLEKKPKKECYGKGLNSAMKLDPKMHTAESVAAREGSANFHPTVKPKKLMTYLIRMVTPPGGIVLDPFMGSGSTGVAARDAGFKFIGVEKEEEYFEIAKKRIGEVK